MRQIMRSLLDYAGFAQLCGRYPIMRKIMRAHNRIIPRYLRLIRHYAICRSGQYAFWGSERWNLKFDPLTSKKGKNWDFKLAVNGNCSFPNSGMVSHIQLKLDTGIDHPHGITWRDSKVKRSRVKVTRAQSIQLKCTITQYWVIVCWRIYSC